MSQSPAQGLVLVLSGPSGVGKDTVWQAAKACLPTFARAVTCTTRPRRSHEVAGVDYHFVSKAQFESLIARDELVEHAVVHGNCYGVPQWAIWDRINAGQDVICVIDVQGALKVRSLFSGSLLVFIKPPPGRESQVLEERIQGRQTVAPEELATRLQTASWELTQKHLYDYEIVNDDGHRAADELCRVVLAEKARRERT
jgi:guanylate kinase